MAIVTVLYKGEGPLRIERDHKLVMYLSGRTTFGVSDDNELAMEQIRAQPDVFRIIDDDRFGTIDDGQGEAEGEGAVEVSADDGDGTEADEGVRAPTAGNGDGRE